MFRARRRHRRQRHRRRRRHGRRRWRRRRPGGGGGTGGGTAAARPIRRPAARTRSSTSSSSSRRTTRSTTTSARFPGAEGTQMCRRSTGPSPCRTRRISSPHDLCHAHELRARRLEQRQDGRLGSRRHRATRRPPRVRAVHRGRHPQLLAVRAHTSRSPITSSRDARPELPGPPRCARGAGRLGDRQSESRPVLGLRPEPRARRIDVLDQQTLHEKQVFPASISRRCPDILPAGVDWKFYGSNFTCSPQIWSMFNGVNHPQRTRLGNVVDASTVRRRHRQQRSPTSSWLVNQDLDDEHPPSAASARGENWTVGHFNKLMRAAYGRTPRSCSRWTTSAAGTITSPPPRQYGCDAQTPYGLGFRLPLIVISPYAKPGFVFNGRGARVHPAASSRGLRPAVAASQDPAAQDGPDTDDLRRRSTGGRRGWRR